LFINFFIVFQMMLTSCCSYIGFYGLIRIPRYIYSKKIFQKGGSMNQTNVNINDIRNFSEIKELLKSCEAFGRTWGRKGSYYYGSHIAFIGKEAIVLLIQGKKKDSNIAIVNFVKEEFSSKDVKLKNEIIAILANHGIIPEEM